MENWLKNCATVSDDRSTVVTKKTLYDSFSAFIGRETEVGEQVFFGYLGLALSSLGYSKVNPVYKRGRWVGYVGLELATVKIANTTINVKTNKNKGTKTNIHAQELIQWMEANYCEGGEEDMISKQELWQHYSTCCGIAEDERQVFFSVLGNSVLKKPSFKRCLKIKHSAFKFLKRTYPNEQTKSKIRKHWARKASRNSL